MARLNSRQVEAFRAVMLTASATRAAEAMHVTQPAVSRLLRELERTLSLNLFERKGNRLQPTHEAVALFKEVERSFIGLERIADAAREIRMRRSGVLRVAAMPAVSGTLLPAFSGKFLSQRPQVDLALFGLISNMVVDWVLSDQCDVGIAATSVQHAAVQMEPLPAVRFVAVVPEGHRFAGRRVLRPRDFEGESHVSVGPSTQSRYRIDEVFAKYGISRQVRVETPLSQIACAMVAAGAGISVVDPFTASGYEGRGVVAIPFEPAIEFQVTALYPAQRPPSALAKEFVGGFAAEIEAFRQSCAPH